MANDVSGSGAVLDFYGEFFDIGVAGRGLFGDVVCRSFILEDVREVDRGDRGVDDFDAGGCLYRSGKAFEVGGTFADGEKPYRTFREPDSRNRHPTPRII